MDELSRVPDEKTPEVRSASQTLMHCLEDFGESEPDRVIVVYTNAAGDLCWSVSGPYSYTRIVGMLECCKAKVMEKFLE